MRRRKISDDPDDEKRLQTVEAQASQPEQGDDRHHDRRRDDDHGIEQEGGSPRAGVGQLDLEIDTFRRDQRARRRQARRA